MLFAASIRSGLQSLLNRASLNPRLRAIGYRYGRSYWRLPSILRHRICWANAVPRLRGARTWKFGRGEVVERLLAADTIEKPALGHRLASQGFRSAAPFVTRLDSAWLVGKFASPITPDGRFLLTAFRDQPRILGLERHPDLEGWLQENGERVPDLPEFEHAWPMVNRLQTNYFHWIVEWCGRLELLEAYRERTGAIPNLIIPETSPRYIRESLAILGFPTDYLIPWPEASSAHKIRNLLLPSFRGSAVAPSPAAVKWLRHRFINGVGIEAIQPRRIIYLSRPRGGWRSVLNDEEVADWFRSEGYEVMQPHRMPLARQIRSFSQSSLIVGLHGAGLTNILFAPQSALLELFGAYGDGLYFGITKRLGQPYEALRCKSIGDDVLVDLEALKRALRRAAAPKPATRHVLPSANMELIERPIGRNAPN